MSASAALTQPSAAHAHEEPLVRRMAVAWQNPESRSVQPVGLLQCDGVVHEFFYLCTVGEIEGFRPFLSFPDVDRVYRSSELFPMFAQRVVNHRRPDRSEHLRQLDLTDAATPWEQLARTEGRLASDTVQVLPEPVVRVDGSTHARFLVAGIRYQLSDEVERDQLLASLREGDELLIVDEPTNPKNSRAMLVSSKSEIPIGWVPDMLVDYVHVVRGAGPIRLAVAHVNGPEAPNHMRLLVRLDGQAPEGYRPFDGPRWRPYADVGTCT